MQEGFALWANPSSPHAEGRKARNALEDARERVKTALGWEGEIIFTSGASEAAQLALDCAAGSARLISAVEHDAILQAAPDTERLPIRSDGSLDLEVLAEVSAMEAAVHVMGAEAVGIASQEDRARVYGEFLGTCAACHDRTGTGGT